MARTDRVRYQVSLSRDLSKRLEALAARPGVYKSKVLAEAFAKFVDAKGADALGERFAQQLDHMSGQLGRIERNGHIELESLALFVRYMLTVNAPLPEGDEAAQAIGRDRFAAFVDRVARKFASGRLTFLAGDEE